MPLLRIQRYPGVRQVFIASEEIGHLATIAISDVGPRYAKLGENADQALVCGVAYGAVSGQVSGKPFKAVTLGIVSGVALAADVNAGDRVTCASAGKITPLNTITPAGAISGYVTGVISGYIPAGATGLASGVQAGVQVSGYIPAGATGFLSGQYHAAVSGNGWASGFLSGLTTIDTPSIFSSGAIAANISGAVAITTPPVFSSGAFVGSFSSGAVAGTAFNTARVLGKALASGFVLSGHTIPILVTLGG